MIHTTGDREYPRVLVIAHNPFSMIQNNGKTLSAFFLGWPRDRIAQIFLTTDVPDFTVCDDFFQLSDFIMAKRMILRGLVDGYRVDDEKMELIKEAKLRIQKSLILRLVRSRIGPGFRLCRDAIWRIGDYRTKNLLAFIEDFDPEVVFFQSSNGVFTFDLVRWICDEWNIPLVMQTTDDYLGPKKSLNPFFWLLHHRINRAYALASQYAKKVFAIGDQMASEYAGKFGGDYAVAMNAVDLDSVGEYSERPSPVRLVFAGNLGLRRWAVLAKVGRALKEIAEEGGVPARLYVYSLNVVSPSLRHRLETKGFCSFMGALDPAQLDIAKREADILVHVESFDRRNRYFTRLSMSTKIPEYLAAGRCVLAIGPAEVASIRYLSETGAAKVVSEDNPDAIKRSLNEIIGDFDARMDFARKAKNLALIRHDPTKTRALVQDEIIRVFGEARATRPMPHTPSIQG